MTSTEAAPSFGDATIKAAFDAAALIAFRGQNMYREIASVKRDLSDTPQAGNPITFTKIDALAPQTTELSETADPTHRSVKPSQVSVTLKERGDSVKMTKKLRITSFINLDMEVPAEVGRSMEESLDIIARDVLVAGTNVIFVGQTAQADIVAGNTLTAAHVRRIRAELAGGKAPPPDGQPMYVGFPHPDVSYDLQQESGQQAWSAPQIYREGAQGVWTGELGALGGVILVENANAPILADAGAAAVDVYQTVFVGQQALGEAIGEAQHMVVAGPFDDLQRFVSVGWYGLLGYGIVRQESLWRVESASSIGAN
jgi:N4-gp56 family major capsid protein